MTQIFPRCHESPHPPFWERVLSPVYVDMLQWCDAWFRLERADAGRLRGPPGFDVLSEQERREAIELMVEELEAMG